MPGPSSSEVEALAPMVPWSDFLPAFMEAWSPNDSQRAEHVTVVGPTGQGKTTLMLALLKERARLRSSHIVIMAAKPKDATLSRLGWPILREWPPGYGQAQVIYWPKFGDVRGVIARQRAAFEPVLADIFADGNRTIYIDEAAYFTEDLKLDGILRRIWQMGRSQNLLVVAGTQRPVRVPRPMFSECSWFAAFRSTDEDELRRVSEIGGADTKALRAIIRTLQPHEFVICSTRTGKMLRSKVSK